MVKHANSIVFTRSSKKEGRVNKKCGLDCIIDLMRNKKESYNSFVTKAGNNVWTASMQLVWNELRSSFTHN